MARYSQNCLLSCTRKPEKNKKHDEPEYRQAPSPGQTELQEPVVGHRLLLQVFLGLLLLVVHICEHQFEVVQAVGQQGPECDVGDPDAGDDVDVDNLPACDGKCLVEVFRELCTRRKNGRVRNSEISRLVLFVSVYISHQ